IQDYGFSKHLVYSLENLPNTPKKKSGRLLKLTTDKITELVQFLQASPAHRRLPWDRLPQALGWDCGSYCIQTALRNEGYRRYVARKKTCMSDRTKTRRLAWCLERQDWTPSQWANVL